jgi:hypothetical protein
VFVLVVSIISLVCGFGICWVAISFCFEQFGGFNVASIGLTMLIASPFFIAYALLCFYALGTRIRRWQLNILLFFGTLVIVVGLGYGYDRLLPDDVLFIWPYFILPLLTIAIAFHLLNRIPQVREQLDKLRETS